MISTALLAGGQSRRMGRDKCLLEIEGVPLWQRQLALLREISDDVQVVAPARPAWMPEDVRWTADAAENRGPLGGVAAALREAAHPLVLVLAVDLPEMTTEYLRRLAARGGGVVPTIDDVFQPLTAVYPSAVADVAAAQLREIDWSLQRLVRRLVADGEMTPVSVADVERFLFRNFNSPID